MKRTLHTHQAAAIDMLRQSVATGHRRPVLQMPTGAGKTVVAGAIVESAVSRGHAVIITVPCISLIDQTLESFWDEGIRDVGVLQGDHPERRALAPVQLASVQTLARRRIPEAGLVLVDECHRLFDFYGRWMSDPEWQGVPFIGLSATPWTKGLGRLYDDLISPVTIQELIDSRFLCPFRALAPSHPDLSGVSTVAGDYHEGQLSKAMQKPKLVADAVETWLAKAEGRPTICFGVDRPHAQMLRDRFLAAGVPTAYIDAQTPRTERTRISQQLESGAIKVITNVGCMTTGVDLPFVSCISLCRPTKSEILYVQIIGRGLRTAPGKTDCLILDHSDTTLRLEMVTDIHHNQLDDGTHSKAKARPKEKRLPKECPRCATVKPVGVHVCPGCGFAPKPVSKTKHIDGELVEITKGKKADHATKQRWYSMLSSIQAERGRKPGWTAHTYRKRFGVWPHGLSDEPIEADAEVRNWVRSRDIAWAKRNNRGAHP